MIPFILATVVIVSAILFMFIIVIPVIKNFSLNINRGVRERQEALNDVFEAQRDLFNNL